MKRILAVILIAIAFHANSQKKILDEIRLYAGVNTGKPKDNLQKYKKGIDIEGAISIVTNNIKYSKNYSFFLEPMIKFKRYNLDAINILDYDLKVSGSDIGVRIYPFQYDELPTSKRTKLLMMLGKIVYVDVSYSSLKFVQINVPNDVKRTMPSWGYGLYLPIYDMSDLGFKSTLILNAGVTQYRWTNASGTKSSFAGKNISLAFAININSKSKKYGD